MSSITPSIGRKVWYHPTLAEIESVMGVNDLTQALDATVIFVTDPDHVSLAITDHAGTPHVRHGVLLVDHSLSYLGGKASWMPHQLSQAKPIGGAPVGPAEIISGPLEVLEPTREIETKIYTDGTSATGPGPLPDLSPAQQDAAEALKREGEAQIAAQMTAAQDATNSAV